MKNVLRPPLLRLIGAAALVLGATACKNHFPHSFTIATGEVEQRHAKPAEGGYYKDWDPWAASIELVPANDLNPVKTQHVLIATVRREDGEPLPNRRVEWIISEGSVGDIIEVDESGWRASRGYKVDNHYAVTHTNNYDHVLTRGTDDPSDDIHLKTGDTWCVISSPIEGTTHIVAYAPGIFDWEKHKVFATKHWQDVTWEWPPDATNPVGATHTFTTKVMKYSDRSPLVGYIVNYQIMSGPGGSLSPGSGQTASVTTDGQGLATVTLTQTAPAEGTNEVKIDIIRPEDKACCKPPAHIATGTVRKTWIGPKIAIQKDATPRATVNEVFAYDIVVSNPSQVPANDVVVTDPLPAGVEFVSSTPSAQLSGQTLSWSLGSLAGGASQTISVKVKSGKSGRYDNCADVRAAMGLSARDCADTLITQPALELQKTCPPEVTLCDEFTYTITVRNRGDGDATNVRVSESMPSGVETEDGRTSLTFDAGTLEPGQAKQASVNVRAKQPGEYKNTATATGDGGLTAEASCTTLVRQPVLKVTKTGPDKRYVGRPLEYQVTVANTGDTAARDTMLIDTLPAGASVQNISDQGSQSGNQVTWNLGTLEPGQSRTVSMTLRAESRGVLRNSAVARAFCAEDSAETQTEVEGIPAVLLEVVDLADPIEVGQNETYEIVVTNQGSADGTNIRVVATLADEQEYVSGTGPTPGTAAGKVVTFAPLPVLAPQAKATYRVTAKAAKAGDVRFKITMIMDQIGRPVEETESTNQY